MPALTPLDQINPARFETPAILKKLASSSRKLAELKGMAASIPNQGILINALALQEAKDSSEIENIVTTHDELFKDDVHPEAFANPAAKEVLRYRQALINTLFMHPYTKIEFVQQDLGVSRITATQYLEALSEGGFVQKQKFGRGNYYVNRALNAVLAG